MRLSEVQLHCLNAISDDYETLSNIVSDVSNQLERSLEGNEIEGVLSGLVTFGWVDVFEYDTKSFEYKLIKGPAIELESFWFLINQSGRDVLDEHWPED